MRREVRVAIVGPFPLPHGGMALQAQKLVRNLESEGFEVTTIRTNPEFPKVLRPCMKLKGIRTLVTASLFLYEILRKSHAVDVVHMLSASYLFFFTYSIPTILVSKLHRKRIILNYRGGEAETFLHRWSIVVKPFFKMCDAVVVPSAFLQSVFLRHNIKTSILPNIVDLDVFKYRERKTLKAKLLVTRHLEKAYNIECIVKAYKILKEKYHEAELGIVGAGEEPEEAERLKKLVREWRIEDVIFYGYIPHEKLFETYNKHDIYVNASYIDNFPGALIEAFACGLPVVSTRAGGIPYIIKDGETGFLVDLNDHVTLAERVTRLLENPQLASQMAKAAKNKCQEYEWHSVFEALLALYYDGGVQKLAIQ